MTIYVQYDPTTADSNHHVYFSSVATSGAAPVPPSNITQITFPDGTQVNGMMLDLSQNPPALIPIPANPITQGVTITSTSTPALNGTYPIDATAQLQLTGTMTYIQVNGTFPGGATTMPWYDVSGVAHTMPSTDIFKAFASAMANYITALTLYQMNGQSGSAPSNQLTIA